MAYCCIVEGRDTQWNRANYLLTEVVLSDKYYKSRAVSITSKVGLTTDRDLSVLTVFKKHGVFYSYEIPEVTWYEPLYNISLHKICFIMSLGYHIFVFWDLFA